MGGIASHVGRFPLRVIQLARFQQFKHPQYAVHRGSDFVAHGGEKVALRLVRGVGGIAGFDHCIRQIPLRGNVYPGSDAIFFG